MERWVRNLCMLLGSALIAFFLTSCLLPSSKLSDDFVSFLLHSTSREQHVDIDSFIVRHKLTYQDFYEGVIYKLMDNQLSATFSNLSYNFQNCSGFMSYGTIRTLISRLAMEYLASPIFLPLMFDAKQLRHICDNLYFLNKTPGNYQKQKHLMRLITSEEKIDFVSACIYLTDKKLKIGWLNKTPWLEEAELEKGRLLKRTDIRGFGIKVDSNGYASGVVFSQ